MLLITHDVEEAIYLADRILVLSPRPTTIQTTFHVDLPHPRKLSSPEAQELARSDPEGTRALDRRPKGGARTVDPPLAKVACGAIGSRNGQTKGGALAAGDGAGQYRRAHARPPQAPEDDAGAAFGPDRHFGFLAFAHREYPARPDDREGREVWPRRPRRLAGNFGVARAPGPRAAVRRALARRPAPGAPRFLVDRAAQRQASAYRELNIEYLFDGSPERSLDCMHLTVEAISIWDSEFVRHPGEKITYVISGAAVVLLREKIAGHPRGRRFALHGCGGLAQRRRGQRPVGGAARDRLPRSGLGRPSVRNPDLHPGELGRAAIRLTAISPAAHRRGLRRVAYICLQCKNPRDIAENANSGVDPIVKLSVQSRHIGLNAPFRVAFGTIAGLDTIEVRVERGRHRRSGRMLPDGDLRPDVQSDPCRDRGPAPGRSRAARSIAPCCRERCRRDRRATRWTVPCGTWKPRSSGRSVWDIAGLEAPATITSDVTIGILSPEETARAAEASATRR